MTHTFVTIIAFLPADRIADVRTLVDGLGNPADSTIRARLDAIGRIHFASMSVFESSLDGRGILVFEFSGDGPRAELLKSLADALGPHLAPIYAEAEERGDEPLEKFWAAHLVTVAQKPFGNPGIEFAGTPGMSVARIRRERDLAAHIAGLLPPPAPGSGQTAAHRLEVVRQALHGDPKWQWALHPEPLPAGVNRPDLPETTGGTLQTVLKLLLPLTKDFLWPLLPIPVVVFALLWWALGFTWWSAFAAFLITWPVTLLLLGLLLLAFYLALRKAENAEEPIDRAPDPTVVADIMKRENHGAQNHLAALSVMKPGRLRRLTVSLAFWVIAQLATRFYRPGFLGSLGTIHFARWVTVPKTGELLFFSNYGGSWESYLEDFITKAHAGLTGVWSNTVGFPKTTNLFQDGATDAARFKRWARRQQVPTSFWYSAYPEFTTTNIRNNAVIRQGLGGTMTEDEARRWLSLFGSSPRPASALESHEIQSLLLGGLGFLRHGAALIFSLSDDQAAAKAFLGELLPQIAFADGRYHHPDATILGLTASAFKKFDLPGECLDSFPPAFLDGMSDRSRARALGDIGNTDPKHWNWGDHQRDPMDGVLLLYASDQRSPRPVLSAEQVLDAQQARLTALLNKHGHSVLNIIPFRTLPDRKAGPEEIADSKCEPFGFVDGISQPVIRGTYKALRGADPIHLVEAGEFILGYPDDRGEIPPSPTLAALHDPANVLPVAANPSADFSESLVNCERDLGRNGSFLAIRQLEQNVEEFWEYCEAEGKRLQSHFPLGVRMPAAEYVAAKIVGRWRDGSPLVRYPRWPAEKSPWPSRPLMRSGTGTGAAVQAQIATAIPASSAAIRAERHPRKTPSSSATLAASAAISSPSATGAAARAKPLPPFEPDNDFLFGAEDAQGLRCPFGAHIRRTNPRESFDPGSREQIAISNRHRIMRVGRFYEPKEGQNKGLFFMCLNSDLERQFEFVQQTWVQNSTFHGLANERDPLMGLRQGGDGYTIPTNEGPMRLANLPEFVRVLGGGYFFLPGRRTLRYLAS